ncbi:MAG TPA: FHA domain-containing protein [Kofleriaceae bacterium]|nr:FHA domain-containing protein [Kofleriaceae bacterium]
MTASSNPPDRPQESTDREVELPLARPAGPIVELRAVDADLAFDLTRRPAVFHIGREPGGGDRAEVDRAADVLVPARYRQTSIRHARVERDGDRLHVIDVGSTNGLELGGRRLTEAWLYAGDVVKLGSLRLIALDERLRLMVPHLAWVLGGGRHAAIAAALEAVADTETLVLLGPPGCDQERLAFQVHDTSPWSAYPFVKGTVAGLADAPAPGPHGTLFLDLVGAGRLAGDDARAWFDARRGLRAVVAALSTHQLDQVLGGRMIGARVIELPPLAARAAEVPQLLGRLLAEAGVAGGLAALTDVERRALCSRSWPGNLEELRAAAAQLVPYLTWGGVARAAPHAGLTRQGYAKSLRKLLGERLRTRRGGRWKRAGGDDGG